MNRLLSVRNKLQKKLLITAIGVLLFHFFSASTVYAGAGSGAAFIIPSSDVVAGSSGTWTIRYTAVDTFINGIIEVTIPDGWSLPQISDSSVAGFTTVTTQGTLEDPSITISQRVVRVHIASLDTNQTVDIVYGDASKNSSGAAIAQTSAENGVEFTVSSDPLGSSASPIASSPTVNVVPASVSKIEFTTPSRNVTAGQVSDVMIIRTFDAYNNPSPVSSDTDVALNSSSSSGTFSHLGGASFTSSDTVTVKAGDDTVSFYYKDTTAGTYTITASAVGESWTDAQQQVDVSPAEPFKLVVSPLDTTATAGDFVRFNITVQDVYGNSSNLSNDLVVTLISTGGDFYETGDHSTAVDQVTIQSGASSVQVDYRNTVKDLTFGYLLGFLDQDGSPPALESAFTNIYIDHAAVDLAVSSISVDKDTATADGSDAVQVTSTVTDRPVR